MSLQPIPECWRKTVAQILRRGERRSIRKTKDFWDRFSADFPDAFSNEITEAIAAGLTRDIRKGCPVTMDPPPDGTTWEFYCSFRHTKLYAKVLLTNDQRTVWLFSAHRPRKRRLRCE